MTQDKCHDKLPENFDWIAYRSMNKDLYHIKSRNDAIKHYKQYGYYQNRKYSFDESVDTKSSVIIGPPPYVHTQDITNTGPININKYDNKINGVPELFDWIAYKSLNKDLRHIRTYGDAVKHYLTHGYYQNRPYTYDHIDTTTIIPLSKIETDVAAAHLIDKNNINYGELNNKYGVPVDFDWLIYKSCNIDLTNIRTYYDAVQHYLEHGHRENRKYTKHTEPHPQQQQQQQPDPQPQPGTQVETNKQNNTKPVDINELQVPHNFDWLIYKNINPDLQHLKNYNDAVRHYNQHGKREGRPYTIDTVNMPTEQPRMEKFISDYDWVTYRPITSSATKNVIPKTDITRPIPHSFDWLGYKTLNPDLSFINSQQDAIKHYQEHGYKENRQYIISNDNNIPTSVCSANDDVPRDFNWIWYRVHYPDLKDKVTNEQEAIQHYLQHGQREGRRYAPDISTLQKKPMTTKETPLKNTHKQTHKQPHKQTHKQHTQPYQQRAKPKITISTPKQKTHQQPQTLTGTIPNIIHFIYGFKEQTTQFPLVNYLSIISAYYLNKPDKIYLYYQYEPFGPWWDKIKPYLILKCIEPPNHIYDKKLRSYAHKADIVRLNILNEEGGVYFDIDTICLRPIKCLLQYDFVMGIQGDNYGLCNAIMLSKPNTEFGKAWIQSYETFNGQWDTHSVKIPLKLSKLYPIKILPNDAFFWPLWDPFKNLILTDVINFDCCRKIFRNSYCLHLWDVWNSKYLNVIDEQDLFNYHSFYNIISRKFLRNNITFIMIINDNNDCIINCLGTYYQILSRDDVSQFIVYNNVINKDIQPELLEYIDNLPNINNKFIIHHGTTKRTIPEIKQELLQTINEGIICFVNQCIHNELLDNVKEYLYDESIGMIGVTGGCVIKNHHLQNITQCQQNTIVDYIEGCQFFRSELKYFNIGFNTDVLYDIDFSFQIRSLGKQLMLIPFNNTIKQNIDYQNITNNQWLALFDKWKHL